MIKFSRLSRLLTSVGVYCAVAIASLMCQPAMADTGDTGSSPDVGEDTRGMGNPAQFNTLLTADGKNFVMDYWPAQGKDPRTTLNQFLDYNKAYGALTLSGGRMSIKLTGAESNAEKTGSLDNQKVVSLKLGRGGTIAFSGNGIEITRVEFYGVDKKRVMSASSGKFTDPVDEDNTLPYYQSTWKTIWNVNEKVTESNATSAHGVNQVVFTNNSNGNMYFTHVNIYYNENITYPNIWRFYDSSEERWNMAKARLGTNATLGWNQLQEGDDRYWTYSESATDYKDLNMNMLTGLKFKKDQADSKIYLYTEDKLLFLLNSTFKIPNVPKGYRVSVKCANDYGGYITFLHENEAEDQKSVVNYGEVKELRELDYTTESDGNVIVSVAGALLIYDICVTPPLYTAQTVQDNYIPGYRDEDYNPRLEDWKIGDKTYKPLTYYEITGDGFMPGGMEINSIPGLKLTFGSVKDFWYVKDIDCEGIGSDGSSVTKYKVASVPGVGANLQNGIPVSGTFYKVEPYVNGKLHIDGTYWYGQDIMVVDQNGMRSNYYNASIDYDTNYMGVTQDYEMVAGHTYYIYSAGETEFGLQKISFNPDWVLNEKSISEFTASYRNNNNFFPHLAQTNDNNEDIHPFVQYYTDGDVVTVDPSTGLISMTGELGTQTIYGIVYSLDSQLAMYSSYVLTVNDADPLYTYTESLNKAETEGVFHIETGGPINNGNKAAAISLPGIKMTFGNGESTENWVATNISSQSVFNRWGGNGVVAEVRSSDNTKAVEATINEYGIPLSGTFYKFTPSVMGFLSIEGSFFRQHYIMLVAVDQETGKPSSTLTRYWRDNSSGVGLMGKNSQKMLVSPGYDYYLFDLGTSTVISEVKSRWAFELHSFTFEPAWVMTNQDQEPVKEATARVNNVNNMLPFIDIYVETEGLRLSSDDTEVASFKDGVLNVNAVGKTDIWATITAKNHNNEDLVLYKNFELTVNEAAVTTYVLQKNDRPKVGDKIDFVEGVNMTYGGWVNPYDGTKSNSYTPTDGDGTRLTDTYKKPDTDNAGSLDNFAYYTDNDNDARDETGKEITKKDLTEILKGDSTINEFKAPVRGSYYKFEAKVAGILKVYVLQNGVINGELDTDYPYATTEKSPYRGAYVVDETGFVTRTNAETGGRYYLDGNRLKLSAIKALIEKLDLGLTVPTDDNDETNINAFREYYDKYLAGKPMNILPTDDNLGWQVMEKSMMSYTFEVAAGQTYYLFGLHTKLGMSGYTFTPYSTSVNMIELNETQDHEPSAWSKTIHNAKVSYSRVFKEGIWTPIVLPFSLNEVQVKNAFGDDVDIVYFDKIENTTINFVRHFHKTIQAGRSCLVKPSKTATGINLGDEFPYVTLWADYHNIEEQGNSDFTWSASYATQSPKKGDYYFSGADGTIKLLNKDLDDHALNGFRVYIKRNPGASADAKILGTMFGNLEDEEVTGIRVINAAEENNVANEDIYTIDGRKINQDINSLPHGVYIINGKKVIR